MPERLAQSALLIGVDSASVESEVGGLLLVLVALATPAASVPLALCGTVDRLTRGCLPFLAG